MSNNFTTNFDHFDYFDLQWDNAFPMEPFYHHQETLPVGFELPQPVIDPQLLQPAPQAPPAPPAQLEAMVEKMPTPPAFVGFVHTEEK